MKFQVGEIALTRRPTINDTTPAGTEVVILAVGPWAAGQRITIRGTTGILDEPVDYVVATSAGWIPCTEDFLRKRPAPGLPDSILRIFAAPVPA